MEWHINSNSLLCNHLATVPQTVDHGPSLVLTPPSGRSQCHSVPSAWLCLNLLARPAPATPCTMRNVGQETLKFWDGGESRERRSSFSEGKGPEGVWKKTGMCDKGLLLLF